MKKMCRTIGILVLILATAIAAACISYADSVPYYTDYKACAVYYKSNINDNWTQKYPYVSMIRGNLYIGIDLLKSIGVCDAFEFSEEDYCCYIDMSKLDNYFGDEDTTLFIKKNAGKIKIPLKYFGTNYADYQYWISFEVVASLARLSYVYIDDVENEQGALYIVPYSGFTGKTLVATGKETALSSLQEGGTKSSFKENELLTVNESKSTSDYYYVQNCYGQAFYVKKSEANIVNDTKSVPCYSRSTKEKAVYPQQISATWSTNIYSRAGLLQYDQYEEKLEGIDLFAAVTLVQNDEPDGSSKNSCDYGEIQAAHAKGYKWWICAMNNFNSYDGDAYIYPNLANRDASNLTIAQYLVYSCIYNADGINVDFESLMEVYYYYYSDSNKESYIPYDEYIDKMCNYYTSFMQDLSVHAYKLGLTTSVCTYAATKYNYNTVWPYDILGQCCDYICPMTYSENAKQSNGAYALMSKSWWTERTDYLASIVPKQKILMGIANYTTDNEGDELQFNGIFYNELSDLEWDDNVGQTLAHMKYSDKDGERTLFFYIEDARSSALKAQYIINKGYGGTISWQYDFMDIGYARAIEIYKAYADVYSKLKTYEDYIPKEEETDSGNN